MINDLCLLTCTYRRPYLIEGLLKSWAITNDSTTNNIAIVENSPLNDVSEYLDSVDITYARFVNQAVLTNLCKTMQGMILRSEFLFHRRALFG